MFANSWDGETFNHKTKSKRSRTATVETSAEQTIAHPCRLTQYASPLFSSPAKNYEMAYSNDTTYLNSRNIRLEFQPGFRILLLAFRNFSVLGICLAVNTSNHEKSQSKGYLHLIGGRHTLHCEAIGYNVNCLMRHNAECGTITSSYACVWACSLKFDDRGLFQEHSLYFLLKLIGRKRM